MEREETVKSKDTEQDKSKQKILKAMGINKAWHKFKSRDGKLKVIETKLKTISSKEKNLRKQQRKLGIERRFFKSVLRERKRNKNRDSKLKWRSRKKI